MDREEIATVGTFPVTGHLQRSLSHCRRYQHLNSWTHVSICSSRLRAAGCPLAPFLIPRACPRTRTYREFDGRHPSRRFHLHGNATINTTWRISRQATRTVHDDLDILHKAIHKFQRLCRGRLSLLSRQPVQSLQHRFYVILSKDLLSKFL